MVCAFRFEKGAMFLRLHFLANAKLPTVIILIMLPKEDTWNMSATMAVPRRSFLSLPLEVLTHLRDGEATLRITCLRFRGPGRGLRTGGMKEDNCPAQYAVVLGKFYGNKLLEFAKSIVWNLVVILQAPNTTTWPLNKKPGTATSKLCKLLCSHDRHVVIASLIA